MHELFTVIFVATFLVRVWLDWGNSNLVSPVSAVAFVAFLILLLPPLVDPQIYVSTQVYIGLTVIMIICAYVPKSFKKPFRVVKNSDNKFVKYFFFFLFIVHFLIALSSGVSIIIEFGIVGAFFRNRLDDYLVGNTLAGGGLSTLSLLTQFVFYYVLGYLLANENTKKMAFLVLVIYIFMIAIYANTRLSLVIPIISFSAYYLYKNRKGVKSITVFVMVFVIILPAYLVVANNLRHGIDDSSIDSASTNNEKIVKDQLNYNKYINELDEYMVREVDSLEYGAGWFWASFGNFVPRFIWEDKPITSFSNRLTVSITQRDISLKNPVRTYTIIGTGYSQFHYFGVIIEVFFYLFLFTKLYYSFLSSRDGVGAFIAFYLAIISMIYFRGETPFVQLTLIYFTYIFHNALCKEK
ncbi:O-antigen polymerase [Pseudoalteromonas apostichopi]|uniref:O-antigen polymerase n=1 Tax=Pseudoalteromonas apostichopi TaxID=3035452 RepID=UPI0025729983|nr:O-antigen polymerase [Pseudoalteromonas sp. FE4]